MRLIEVARTLGMTGQELRRELSQVDFGVRPTDREVPDQIAQGIIRYMAQKHGITIAQEDTEEESREEDEPQQDEEGSAESEGQEGDAANPLEQRKGESVVGKRSTSEGAKSKVHVLRKLTLEDVSESAVRAAAVRAAPPPRKRKEKARSQSPDRKRSLATQEQIKKKDGLVELPDSITVKEFAEKTGVQVPQVIATLMKSGIMANINQSIDFDTAAIVAEEHGVQVKKAEARLSAEKLLAGNLEVLLKEDDASVLLPRPPVVTVMGHVDHGKTAILDAIRKTDVAGGEAGGITQGIGAYQVVHADQPITFLDTPGHQAFTAMRARGAQITDVVILVVAADEGVKPTTEEAIDHARDAGVPILVALNKADKEGADPDRVKGELAQHNLQSEDWGGKTPTVLCSAKTGQGIDDILDSVLVLAEEANLKANPNRSAVATVIESHLDSSLGPVASLVVNAGTLHIGDIFVCGVIAGKIKSMVDAHGERLKEVGPSGAVRIAGLDAVPETGDILQVVKSESASRQLLNEIIAVRELRSRGSFSDLVSRLSEGKITMLKVVLKAESLGSLEAIESSLTKLKSDKGVATKVIHGAVGEITESDVMMASASDAVVLGFNTVISSHVEHLAAEHGVKIRLYDVIYELLDDVTALLAGLIEPVEEEKITGHLEVRGIFFQKKNEQVIGGKVADGSFKRVPFRVLRNGETVGTGRITYLKHIDKDIKEAKEGSECGMRVDCPITIAEGDVLEGYITELKKKEL